MPAAPVMPSVTHIALTVSDLARSEEWYTSVLGAAPVRDEDSGPFRHVVYQLGPTMLALHAFRDLATREPFNERRSGLDHVALGCRDRDGLATWVTRLDGLGINHGGVVNAGFGSGLVFRDPDSIAITLFAQPDAGAPAPRDLRPVA